MRKTILIVVMMGMMSAGGRGQNVPYQYLPYLKALGELRTARAWLDGWQVDQTRREDVRAIAEIDAALELVKHASIDDGKALSNHPPVDLGMSPKDRLKQANSWIWKAHLDLEHAADVEQERGLRERVLRRVDQAHYIVDSMWRVMPN